MRHRRLLITLAVAVAMAVFVPAASGETPSRPHLDADDWEAPVVVTPGIQATPGIDGLFDEDPTGLVPKTPFVQRYSLDQDHWEVWRCGDVSTSLTSIINTLESATVDYYDSLSGGLYEPVYIAGGTIADNENCLNGFINGDYDPIGNPEGLLIVNTVTGSGGYSSPGTICIDNNPDCASIGSTFPANRRYTVLGEPVLANWPSVMAHELGHALQWPHSNSGIGDEYDNPIDLMSGNNTIGGWTEPDPYATLSYNRFQSGWVAADDVVVADGSHQAMTLEPHNVAGTQLFAIKTGASGLFYVFGARTTSAFDPIPTAWQGVEVYEVDYYCDDGAFGGGICPGIFRDQTQEPPSHDGVAHVLQVGESITLEGVTVTVTGTTATGYTITADPGAGSSTTPSAPGMPSADAGDGEATLAWSAAADGGSPILNYDVEVENRDFGGSTVTAVGVTLSTSIAGLDNGTTYRARVRAGNAIGDGDWSVWSADFVPGTVPDAPGIPVVTAGNSEVSVSWSAPADDGGATVANYELQVNDTTTISDIYVDVGTATSASIDGLTNGHTYRIRVRAENSFGVGAWSDWSAGVTPLTVPSTPQNPTVTVTAVGSVTATWSAPINGGGSAIIGYELTLENVTGGGTATYDTGTATTYGFAGLDGADTYRYRVRAENSDGWSLWSAWSPDFIPGTVPSAPGVPTLAAGDGEVSASWTAAETLGGAVDQYELQLENVTRASTSVESTSAISFTFASLFNGDSYRLRVRAHNSSGWGPWSAWSDPVAPLPPPDTFVDDDGSVFEADIEWLAAAGVTRGCNPPVNDRFCPDAAVTRGQMAAFLVRALGLADQLDNPFTDDDASIFETDIEKLAAAGITRGCNPPMNDRFCPDAPVTREQMAAFLVRALGYTDVGDGDLFVDDDDSIFSGDIDRLATAGVTRGCNPPTNDRFCPTEVVTRGQMAAFLHRALG